MTLYTERIVDQTDQFADSFVRKNIVHGYDVVTTLWHSIIKLTADAILFREIQNKKRNSLTHTSRMEFPTDIHCTGPLPILGLLGCIFHFYSKLNRNFFLKTVEDLIRRLVLRRLI